MYDLGYLDRPKVQSRSKLPSSHIVYSLGKQGVDAVRTALQAGDPYDLVCLDIMMPEMDGQEALKQIRQLEQEAGVTAEKRARVIMTTAHADRDNVLEAIQGQCDYFLVKPIDNRALLEELRRLGLIDDA